MRELILLFAILVAIIAPVPVRAEEKAETKYDPKVVELLEKASSYLEEDSTQRKDSIDELIEIGGPAVSYLCTRLNTDNVMERIALVNSLTDIGGLAVDELHKALKVSEGKAKTLAMKIIARIGSEKSLQVFKDAIDDAEWSFRSSAAEGLSKIKTEESTGILFDLLKDEDDDVRLKALLALADRANDKIIRELTPMFDDPSFIVRFGVSEVMGDYGAPAVPMLEEKLGETEKLITRLLIIETLGNTGSETASEVAKKYLEDDEPLMRAYAAIAYAKTAPTSERAHLETLLAEEKTPLVRKAMVRANDILSERYDAEQKEKQQEPE